MQEVIAVIRVNRMQRTKDALAGRGYNSITATRVLGRGRQRGLHYELRPEAPEKLEGEGRMRYIPKKFLSIVVKDSQVGEVVKTIIRANQTGKIGDGKVFVCPVENAIRVRTGEEARSAIQ